MLNTIHDSAIGSIAGERIRKYPNFKGKRAWYRSMDYKLQHWRKHLVRLSRHLGSKAIRGRVVWDEERSGPLADLTAKLRMRAIWGHGEQVEGVHMWDMRDIELIQQIEGHAVAKLRVSAQIHEVDKYLRKAGQRARDDGIRKAIKKRNGAFEEEGGKGKGRVLDSIFRKRKQAHDLIWARKPDGELAYTAKEVGETARDKFEAHFATRVSMEERWASWEHLMRGDTEGMQGHNRAFVDECYGEMWRENHHRAAEGKWWVGIYETGIGVEEIELALKETKSGKATGPSEVSVDMIKCMDRESLAQVARYFNICRQTKAVPDSTNGALLRLLPKTDKGMSDLDRTRPINLTEQLLKVYERVMIGRVVAAIEKHKILDMSQYGAVARAGVQAPLRVIAEVMDDARVSGQELHLFATDLSKAFDTQEYWSQALSWRSLGMPEDLVRLLVGIDAGSHAPWIAEEDRGKGATTSILMGKGRRAEPFAHGRGVRQGSVGGPLKWIVFMNFWLAWVKRKRKGDGYTMIGGGGQSTMEQAVEGMERRAQEERGRGGGEGEGGDNTGTGEGGEGKPCRPEVIGQMFVDDSMWFAKGAVGMQRMVNMHETFCTFHGLQLNKEKCEHMAMNAPAYNLQWAGEQAKLQAAVARGDSAQVLEELKGKVQVATKRGDDRHMKYLGVTFEARKGWARQRGKMDTDFKTMRDRLMSVAITTQQAVYSVNSVVIPKLMYPQQVAIVPRGTLKRWDTELRGGGG